MRKKHFSDSRYKTLTLVLSLILVASSYFVYLLSVENQGLKEILSEKSEILSDKLEEISDLEVDLFEARDVAPEQAAKLGRFHVVTIRPDGSGKITPLLVKISDGDGSVSANINKVDFERGMQRSIRTAVNVSRDFANFSVHDKDITINLENDGSRVVAVDGGSAGTSMTVAIIGAMTGMNPRQDAVVTGGMNSEGRVTPVANITVKTLAAKDFGANVMLVPRFQGVEVDGIEVVEVGTIQEAAEILFENNFNSGKQ